MELMVLGTGALFFIAIMIAFYYMVKAAAKDDDKRIDYMLEYHDRVAHLKEENERLRKELENVRSDNSRH